MSLVWDRIRDSISLYLTLLQPSRGVFKKRCSENMQQICRRHPCQSVISIKLLCNFIEITLRHVCSPVYLLDNLKTPVLKSTFGWLFLNYNVRRNANSGFPIVTKCRVATIFSERWVTCKNFNCKTF